MKKIIMPAALIAVISAIVMCSSGCSLLSRLKNDNSAPASATAPAPTETPKQESIIGSWTLDKILDKSGTEVSPEDINIPVEPFNEMSGLTGSILSGTNLKFGDDGKVSFLFVSADYTYENGSLIISSPQFEENLNAPCEINGSKMTMTLGDYKFIFKKS